MIYLSEEADPETLARSESGRQALAAIQTYGMEMGGEIIRGRAVAFMRAHAIVFGWDATQWLLAELRRDAMETIAADILRSRPVDLRLVIDNSGGDRRS